MQKMDKKMTWTIAAVVLIIIVAAVVAMTNKKNNDSASVQTPTPPPATNPTAQNPPATTPGKLSYTDAVKKYGTNRIQFAENCQATPNQVTFKAGTAVMFDNRSKISHVVTFGGTKYTIKANDYVVVSMTAAKYPTTVLVDCDKSQNVATVLIQK